MAKPAAQEDTRLDNATDEKALFHDFVYRDDMSVEKIAEHLDRDWDDTYNWLRDKLEEAKDDE